MLRVMHAPCRLPKHWKETPTSLAAILLYGETAQALRERSHVPAARLLTGAQTTGELGLTVSVVGEMAIFRQLTHVPVFVIPHRTGCMVDLPVQIIRFVEENQPPIVEARFRDSIGCLPTFIDKSAIFTDDWLCLSLFGGNMRFHYCSWD